jgi:hypothetical protein
MFGKHDKQKKDNGTLKWKKYIKNTQITNPHPFKKGSYSIMCKVTWLEILKII